MGSKGFNQDPKQTKFGSVLCKLISQQCPNVETISFAGNRIDSLFFFENLSTFLPNLKNLSFKDNNLRTYGDLQGWNFTKLGLNYIYFRHSRIKIYRTSGIDTCW